jgi:hypothetical protein
MRSFSVTDFIKRALPFFAALVIGVFIASFFVDLSRPRFSRGARKHHEMKQLRIENEELKNENLRLRNELENHRLSIRHPGDEEWSDNINKLDSLVPPPIAPVEPRREH